VWPSTKGAAKNWRLFFNISTTAEASDFKFGAQLGFAKQHHNIARSKKGAWPWTKRFSFNIYTMTEASDFKFGTQLGYAKAHHKITPKEKSGCGFGLGELLDILEFLYNISVTAESSNFKIGILLGFAEAHHKIPHGRTSRRGPKI